jgi:hypothetical protein
MDKARIIDVINKVHAIDNEIDMKSYKIYNNDHENTAQY